MKMGQTNLCLLIGDEFFWIIRQPAKLDYNAKFPKIENFLPILREPG